MFFIAATLLLLLALYLSSKIVIEIAIVVAIFGFIGILVKQATKDLEKKNKDLENQNTSLREEKKELLNRHIDITQIKDIFKVALTEVESVDVRTYNRPITENIRFYGALRIKLKAQYGLDIADLRLRYIDGTLQLANVRSKFLSFTNRTATWDFCMTLEYDSNRFLCIKTKEKFWRTKDSNDKYTIDLSEKFRREAEQQLNEKGMDSVEWIKESIQYKVLTGLQKMFPTTRIQILDSYDDSFLSLQDFMNEQQKAIKALHE